MSNEKIDMNIKQFFTFLLGGSLMAIGLFIALHILNLYWPLEMPKVWVCFASDVGIEMCKDYPILIGESSGVTGKVP